MQIFEKRNDAYRTTQRCGYCRQEGHNQYNCPEVAKDWAFWKDYKIPVNTRMGWYMSRNNPKYWGEWYTKCKEVYEEQQRRKKNPKTIKRAASKCGFCGSYEHNRRNCPEMKSFLQKCYKANENWRREAYKEIVVKHGISVGAAFEVKKRDGWGSNAEIVSEVALITKVNFDSLNVMAAKTGYYDGHTNPYECGISVSALINGQEKSIKVHTDYRSAGSGWESDLLRLNSNIVVRDSSGYYGTWSLSKLLSRSEHPLNEKWVTDYKDAFVLLLKKRSMSQLEKDDIVPLIEKWEQHLEQK